MVGGLETQTLWPNRRQIVNFESLDFLLQPAVVDGQHRSHPAIAIRADGFPTLTALPLGNGRDLLRITPTGIMMRPPDGDRLHMITFICTFHGYCMRRCDRVSRQI